LPASTLALMALVSRDVWTFGARNRSLDLQRGYHARWNIQGQQGAKRRLADEYDAAQERGEVAVQGKPSKTKGLATASQIGLSYKEIHEARAIRDAEKRNPGIVRRPVDAASLYRRADLNF